MKQRVLLDAGPLIAFIDSRDSFHQWATKAFQTGQYPFFTCEPVITEACFLLKHISTAKRAVMTLVSMGAIRIDFSLENQASDLSDLMTRYKSVPMSLADACLVKMAEIDSKCKVMTIDSDFNIYRIHRNRTVSLISPEGR